MKLDREKINLIMIASDAKGQDEGQVLIREKGKGEDDEGWLFFPADTGKKDWSREGKPDVDGNCEMNDIDIEELLKDIEGKDVDFLTNWDRETREYERFSDWDKFAKSYGALELEVLSTKVPRPVARYFKRFVGDDGVSSQLRKLVYEYVQGELKERAASLMFEE